MCAQFESNEREHENLVIGFGCPIEQIPPRAANWVRFGLQYADIAKRCLLAGNGPNWPRVFDLLSPAITNAIKRYRLYRVKREMRPSLVTVPAWRLKSRLPMTKPLRAYSQPEGLRFA